MEFIEKIFDYKEDIGQLFFCISILICLFMFISPLVGSYIHIDERFTIGLMKFNFVDMMSIIKQDVHPPLYYLILYGFLKVCNFLSINLDILYLSKIVSVLPYVFLLIVSFLKIKKDYNWFTAGLFTLMIGTMSAFFINFSTVRMYGWSMLWLVLTFIYYCDIVKINTRKSWILFTLFSILSMYTHNILLITLFLMYLLLLFNMLSMHKKDLNKLKSNLKNFLISAFVCLLVYLPWFFVLLNQINSKRKSVPSPTLNDILNYLSWYMFNNLNFNVEDLILKILAIMFLLFLICTFIIKRNQLEKYYSCIIGSGYILYFFTLIISIFLLMFTFKSIAIRNIIPVLGIFWLVTCIFIDKLKDKRLWMILVIVLLLFSCCSVMKNIDFGQKRCDIGDNETDILTEMSSDGDIIIYTNKFQYVAYHDYFKNTKEYSTTKMQLPDNLKLKTENDLSKLLENNENKNIYIITENRKFPSDISTKKIGWSGPLWFIQLNKK